MQVWFGATQHPLCGEHRHQSPAGPLYDQSLAFRRGSGKRSILNHPANSPPWSTRIDDPIADGEPLRLPAHQKSLHHLTTKLHCPATSAGLTAIVSWRERKSQTRYEPVDQLPRLVTPGSFNREKRFLKQHLNNLLSLSSTTQQPSLTRISSEVKMT
jgi:hypothetical protein